MVGGIGSQHEQHGIGERRCAHGLYSRPTHVGFLRVSGTRLVYVCRNVCMRPVGTPRVQDVLIKLLDLANASTEAEFGEGRVAAEQVGYVFMNNA